MEKRLRPGSGRGLPPLRRLMSYRLHVLVSVNERAATALYGRLFGISLREWRVLAALGQGGALSVNQIAKRIDLDKSQVSRTAVGLVKSGHVNRTTNQHDARSVILRLTPSGRAFCRRILLFELERQERLIAGLSADERAHLDSALGKLTAQVRRMYEEEKQLRKPSATP